jgi:hypothetical protein
VIAETLLDARLEAVVVERPAVREFSTLALNADVGKMRVTGE